MLSNHKYHCVQEQDSFTEQCELKAEQYDIIWVCSGLNFFLVSILKLLGNPQTILAFNIFIKNVFHACIFNVETIKSCPNQAKILGDP